MTRSSSTRCPTNRKDPSSKTTRTWSTSGKRTLPTGSVKYSTTTCSCKTNLSACLRTLTVRQTHSRNTNLKTAALHSSHSWTTQSKRALIWCLVTWTINLTCFSTKNQTPRTYSSPTCSRITTWVWTRVKTCSRMLWQICRTSTGNPKSCRIR